MDKARIVVRLNSFSSLLITHQYIAIFAIHNRFDTQLMYYTITIIGRQHRKDIDLNLKPFRGNNNINNYIFHTKKDLQFKTSNKYLLLLLLYAYVTYPYPSLTSLFTLTTRVCVLIACLTLV